MTEIILGIIIIILIAVLVSEKRENAKERKRYTNAILARTPEQFREFELTDKIPAVKKEVDPQPDIIPETEQTDEEFKMFIKNQV